jgi:hypothetical protein
VARAIAINVGANTTLPGFRGPVRPDGSFEYAPIPEREPVAPGRQVPTYADLDLSISVPPDLRDRPVHLDPAFRGYADSPEYTYGDEHGVKAGPISTLERGDFLLFYATLEPATGTDPPSLGGDPPDDPPDWMAPEWGAYLIGAFRLDADPYTGAYADLPARDRERLADNAHAKRRDVDAEVLVYGDPDDSRLFDRAIPLSSRTAGSDANRVVTDLSGDSGKGPWWRRPLRFDAGATGELLEILEEEATGECFRT